MTGALVGELRVDLVEQGTVLMWTSYRVACEGWDPLRRIAVSAVDDSVCRYMRCEALLRARAIARSRSPTTIASAAAR